MGSPIARFNGIILKIQYNSMENAGLSAKSTDDVIADR